MAEIFLHSDITQPKHPWKSASRIHDGVLSSSSGLDAPRNSLDFTLYKHDDIITVRQKPLEGSIQAASKKLIHKQIPSQPSVIARLMGMDTIPIPTKDAVMVQAEEASILKPPSAAEIKVTSRHYTPFKQSKCSLLSYYSSNGDYRHCLNKMRSRKARPCHHHPQEELLQKIKEDFQAWQTSRVLENARSVAALGSKPLDGSYIQILAQENLRNEKMARYGYGGNNMMENMVTLKNVAQEGNSEIATAKVADESESEERVIKVLRASRCAESEKCRALEAGKGELDHSMSKKLRPPTRIVILKPSSDIDVDDQEPMFGSSKVRREDNMEEFLEEVKERLKKELKVNPASEVRTTRGTDPKQIARDIAEQIRETVTKDLGKRLSRPESFSAHGLNSINISRTETVPEERTNEEGLVETLPVRRKGRVRSLTDASLSGTGFDKQSCTSTPSPVSPLEVEEGHSSRHFFSELTCTFPELSPKCTSELEVPISEFSYKINDTADTESDRDKAYIREVLITAGLFNGGGSLNNKANTRADSMARPICDYVFEEVEEAYYYRGKKAANGDDEIGRLYSNTEEVVAMNHRMLFDLANEALQNLLGSVRTGSSLHHWLVDSTAGMSRGRKLLVDDVWRQVQATTNPPMQQTQTIYSMVARQVRKSAWLGVLYEDVYVVGRKIERAILDELIGDIAHEVFI